MFVHAVRVDVIHQLKEPAANVWWGLKYQTHGSDARTLSPLQSKHPHIHLVLCFPSRRLLLMRGAFQAARSAPSTLDGVWRGIKSRTRGSRLPQGLSWSMNPSASGPLQLEAAAPVHQCFSFVHQTAASHRCRRAGAYARVCWTSLPTHRASRTSCCR